MLHRWIRKLLPPKTPGPRGPWPWRTWGTRVAGKRSKDGQQVVVRRRNAPARRWGSCTHRSPVHEDVCELVLVDPAFHSRANAVDEVDASPPPCVQASVGADFQGLGKRPGALEASMDAIPRHYH
eukprot:scaffold76_cov363-Pavlova_lutheri.AAC.16